MQGILPAGGCWDSQERSFIILMTPSSMQELLLDWEGLQDIFSAAQEEKSTEYCARLVSAQDYSAVTAACMMTKKELFQKVEGFDEGFQVAFNDIDYCMKIRKGGKLVVFTPYAELYHYESKSRGKEEDSRFR